MGRNTEASQNGEEMHVSLLEGTVTHGPARSSNTTVVVCAYLSCHSEYAWQLACHD